MLMSAIANALPCTPGKRRRKNFTENKQMVILAEGSKHTVCFLETIF